MARAPQGSQKTAWIAGTAVLALAIVLGVRMISRSASGSDAGTADKLAERTAEQRPSSHAAEELPTGPKAAEAAPAAEASKTKLSQRKKSMEIRDLEKHGIFVEAEQVGKNSASGKVRVKIPGGAVLEADRAKMSSTGMLVAEGNPVMVKGESRAYAGGENSAMAIFYDEKKQSVIMRAGSADKVADERIDDSNVIDPDRGNLAPPETEE